MRSVVLGVVILLVFGFVAAEDPYKYFTWTVTYGTAAPLGVPQQVRKFINATTSTRVMISEVFALHPPHKLTLSWSTWLRMLIAFS